MYTYIYMHVHICIQVYIYIGLWCLKSDFFEIQVEQLYFIHWIRTIWSAVLCFGSALQHNKQSCFTLWRQVRTLETTMLESLKTKDWVFGTVFWFFITNTTHIEFFSCSMRTRSRQTMMFYVVKTHYRVYCPPPPYTHKLTRMSRLASTLSVTLALVSTKFQNDGFDWNVAIWRPQLQSDDTGVLMKSAM